MPSDHGRALLKRVESRAIVFRFFLNRKDQYPPNAEKPLTGSIRLTGEDYADGRRRRVPALFSIFNAARTSVAQARRLRGQTEADSTPFCWRVEHVEAIDGFNATKLRVFADPDRWSAGAGARGHCGIGGLAPAYEEPRGAEKLVLKTIRSALIDACERFDARRHPQPSIGRQLVDGCVSSLARALSRDASPENP